jgi:ribokinase
VNKPIIVVGSINLDLVATSARLPAAGETVIGKSFDTFLGGKGANQAVAVAKLGYPAVMIGKVGHDAFGSQLVEGLREAGVETCHVTRAAGASGVALILTDAHGENSIVVVPGANEQLMPIDLEQRESVFQEAGMILAQLEIPLETVDALGRIARKHNVPLVLDPAPAQVLPLSILHNVRWITPNESEARHLLQRGNERVDENEVADKLLAAGVAHVVLKLGARGSMVAENATTKTLVPGFQVMAVDTTAAGDAFNGAFAVATLRGKKAVDAARFANAVAAISVTRRGAQSSMPAAKEVEDFLDATSCTAER